jgi:hypothetical protein
MIWTVCPYPAASKEGERVNKLAAFQEATVHHALKCELLFAPPLIFNIVNIQVLGSDLLLVQCIRLRARLYPGETERARHLEHCDAQSE